MTAKKRGSFMNRRESMHKEMSFSIVNYKGYKIHAVPYQLAETGEWTGNIRIFHDCGDKISLRQFSIGNSLKTRNEAVACSLNFGKQIINDKFEN
jgi:hypothetical protein